jgi:hypothetical protein
MPTETATQTDSALGIIPAAPWRVASVAPFPHYKLRLVFQDGLEGAADLTHLVQSADAGIYASLKDEKIFAAVRLELGVPTWPNGADLAPDWLYDEIQAKGVCSL